MNFSILSALSCFLLTMVSVLSASDPFPKLNEIKKNTLMPEKAVLSVAPDGHFLVNGIPRYLPSTLYYEGVASKIGVRTAGYPEELRWLYEDTLDYAGHQRLGLDATGTGTPNDWIRKYRGGHSGSFGVFSHEGLDKTRRIFRSGLPLYADFTCAPWHHGGLRYKEGMAPSREAFTVSEYGNYHWMPYSATTPEGRRLYLEMWRRGAEFFRDNGVRPFVYELFNEPDYNDSSPFNRKLFAERMRKKYTSVEKLNAAWHSNYASFEEISKFKRLTKYPALHVEWRKFMEDCFTDICRAGIAEIRRIDPRPEALFCFQPLSGWRSTHCNLHDVNAHMNLICAGTGGGDAVQARCLKAVADGKPILDGETYVGATRDFVRNKLFLQYMRGFNASFVFKWDRRPMDSDWKNKDAAGGKIVAEKFRYLLLNPYAVPAEALAGIRDAKEEILRIGDLFTPRKRGVDSKIAVLFSYPTHRLATPTGNTAYNLFDDACLALEYAPFAYDAVFEKQLADGARTNRYKIIVVPGVNASYDESPALLEKFAREGGMLIFLQDTPCFDEIGNPRPDGTFPGIRPGKELVRPPEILICRGKRFQASPARETPSGIDNWIVSGKIGRTGCVFEKKFGKGRLVFINAKMPIDILSLLLKEFVSERGISPLCGLSEADTGKNASAVEVAKAVREGEAGYILFNHSLAPRLIRFRPAEPDLTFALAFQDGGFLPEKKNGEYLLHLMPSERTILIGSSPAGIEKRFGKLPFRPASETEKRAKEEAARRAASRCGASKVFSVDPNSVKFIDLRRHANRAYIDRIPGDGRGGWTDQGENSLHNTPWGITDCNGVPFDFIRTDMNDDKTCLVLGSKRMPECPREFNGIKVETKASALYFLHASAWIENGEEVFRYRIHYSDGSSADIPVRDGKEIFDWYHLSARVPGLRAVPGWMNRKKRGLWIYRWENPHPEKEISTIDVLSAWNNSIGIVCAVTVELPGASLMQIPLENFTLAGSSAWGGIRISKRNGILEFKIDDKSRNWCVGTFPLAERVSLPPRAVSEGFLIFEINGRPDLWGKPIGRQGIQVRLSTSGPDGKTLKSSYLTASPKGGIDNDPGSWQTVRLPLNRIIHAPAAFVKGFSVQFQHLPPERGGVDIKNVRLLFPPEH